MAFAKKAVEGVTAPLKAVKSNPWAIAGILLVILVAFRFRGRIMALLGNIPVLGTGANKIAGEG